MSFKILDPHFVDLQKTVVRFKLVNDNGVTSTADLNVPQDFKRGVNKYWDYILDNFDVNEMRKRRNDEETRKKKERELADKKRKAHEENIRLRNLFNKKMKAFELPFIESASNDIKSAIRRAPDDDVLSFILHQITVEFMKENDMDYIDYLDYLDDLEDKKAEEKLKASKGES